MTDVSELLVQAVKDVLPKAYDDACGADISYPTTDPEDWSLEARRSVCAVLRELSRSQSGGYDVKIPAPVIRAALDAMADEIERKS